MRIRILGLVAMLAVVVLVGLLVRSSTTSSGPGADDPPVRDARDGATSAPRAPGAVSEVLPGDATTPGAAAGARGENLAQGASPGSRALPGLDRAARTPQRALVPLPLPRNAVRQGRLVAGHPAEVLRLVPSTRVRSSSVSSSGRRLQVALVATTARSPDSVLLFYRQSLVRLGFTESRVAAPAGATALGFRRGADSVAVTVAGRGASTSYTLLSTLHAGRG